LGNGQSVAPNSENTSEKQLAHPLALRFPGGAPYTHAAIVVAHSLRSNRASDADGDEGSRGLRARLTAVAAQAFDD